MMANIPTGTESPLIRSLISVAVLALAALQLAPEAKALAEEVPIGVSNTNDASLANAPRTASGNANDVANERGSSAEDLAQPRVELGLGLQFNSRRSVDGRSFEFEYPPVFSFGLAWDRFAAQLERVEVDTADGNATIAVQRRREAWLLRAKSWWGGGTWRPLASIGWGVSREHVATRLSGASNDAEAGTGVWTGYWAGAAGLRAQLGSESVSSRRLAVEILVRAESSPQYGVLGKNNPRWGAGFQLFYAFN